MNKHYLTQTDIGHAAVTVGQQILDEMAAGNLPNKLMMYGIPRGGIPAMYAVLAALGGRCMVTNDPKTADIFIDDIIDTGETASRYTKKYGKPVYALYKRGVNLEEGQWLVFPWEGVEGNGTDEASATDNVTRLLQYIGEDPLRGGLLETPKRVLKSWAEQTAGYQQDAASLLKCFEDGANGCDEMVTVRDIPFYSNCEHHMVPFFGTATVSYIPNGKIVGLSKIPRLVDMFAKRLQVQERLTNQIADALQQHLSPRGVGVIIKARHLCMEARGIAKQGSVTTTSALRGAMRTDPAARAEFLDSARG